MPRIEVRASPKNCTYTKLGQYAPKGHASLKLTDLEPFKSFNKKGALSHSLMKGDFLNDDTVKMKKATPFRKWLKKIIYIL